MNVFRLPSFLLRNIKHSIVIIHIGSNDIAHNYSTASICAAIIDTARTLKDTYHVKHINICSCTRRERNIGKLSSSQSNDVTIAVNNKLSIDIKNLTGISYYTNKGFWANQSGTQIALSHWSADGIIQITHKGEENMANL